ncbi:MAG TPA: YceD family protein [Rhodanobacteraceae bacterium]|nr:YceD family protein [Rhodanobacteraceae bacterium]
MSASLPDFVDAERMVAGRRSFQGVLQVAELPRLVDALAKDSGEIAYVLDFEQGQLGDAELHVRLAAQLTLECQRTLQPFQWPIEVDSRLGLLASEDDAAALPEPCEPLLLDHGSLQPRRVIEDELLLALPLVPIKPGSEILQGEWNSPGQAPQDAQREAVVAHPFADLRDLLQAREKHR